MYQFLTKNGTVVAFVVGVAISVIGFFMISNGLSEFNAMPKDERATTTIFDFILKAAIGLAIVCAVIALVFGILQMFTNPKSSLKIIIGLAVIAVLFLVFYNTATIETEGSIFTKIQEDNISENVNRYITASLKTTLVLALGAVAAFAFSELRNLFK